MGWHASYSILPTYATIRTHRCRMILYGTVCEHLTSFLSLRLNLRKRRVTFIVTGLRMGDGIVLLSPNPGI
ncbi:uncharacterized protein EAE98_004792 [Botrytis deweyae]|uniref:Uncharacterized protein n=1 Tax=Botrytis deweyae TaxID=2478750 RepID=A0ABQ7IPD3_9HELO|nr:uncharacterized protein EAE98_004792 [Botrytis deweyae]KAF7930392.1 hypothetical protein EAE98_004792 [Botrytis deweyae]